MRLADDAGGEAEEEGDDQVLHRRPLLRVRQACWPNVQAERTCLKARRLGPTKSGEPDPGHLAMAIPQATPSAARRNRRQHRRKHQHVWKDKHWRWVADGQGDWRDQGYIVRHKHKPQASTTSAGPGRSPPRRAAAAVAAPSTPTRGRPAPTRAPSASQQATRLLEPRRLRAAPGQAEQLASLGLLGAVQSLTRPSGAANLTGRRRSTTTATRSPPPTPGATTTSGGSTAWSAPTSRWSSGWRWSSTTGSRPRWRGVSKPQQMIDQSNLFRAALLRLLPRPLQGGDDRPGDAAVAERRRKPQGRAERELRPRDDGAVHPRRRPRRLHRGRHPRTGAGADRLAQRLVGRTRRPQLPLRPQTPRRRTTRRSSARPATGAGKTPAGSASRTPSTPPSSSKSCGATSSPRRPRRRPANGADRDLPSAAAGRSGRCSRRS